MRDTDVLVVGAGPTGLALACELTRHGVNCRIVEQLTEQVVWSKAAVVHARTMEAFDNMGAVEALLGYAKPLEGVRVHSKEQLVARIGFDGIASAYPHVYGISQHDTELVLTGHLEKFGGRIERGKKLLSFEQDAEGVRATIEPEGGGASEVISAHFIVGCDGAHSAVRKSIGCTFEGSSYEEHLIQADLHVDFTGRGGGDEILVYLHEDGPFVMFPLFKDGRYRVIVFLMPGAPEIEPTLEVFQRFIDERGPKGAKVHDPAWMVAFRIHCRHADRHREGNAFLAGDAAHIHSPVGGQGMNTGIQDAYNLAWKLALVVRGRGQPALLDSYEAERKPIAMALLASTDTATRGIETFGALKNRLAAGVRNRLMGLVTSSGLVQARVVKQLSMLDLHYHGSPIVAEDRPQLWGTQVNRPTAGEAPNLLDWVAFGDGPAPGDRATEVFFDVAPHEGAQQRLGDLLRGAKHTLLLFDGAAATPEGYANLAAIAAKMEERYSDVITTHIVVPHAEKPSALGWSGSVVLDSAGELHREYGARSESLYLVRPDGYIAYRAQPANLEKLEAYLQTLFR